MSIAYQHRPLSRILAPTADAAPESQTSQSRDPKTGQFVKADTVGGDTPDIPEKYRGKSIDDVIKMHQNSESALGRYQNEVGQLRGLVRDLSQLQRAPQSPTEVTKDVDLSGDELITDPVGSIKKVVQSIQPQQEAQEADPLEALDLQSETNALFNDYPNMQEIVLSDEFKSFANRTSGRVRDQQIAADPKAGVEAVRAARRLLEDFDDFKQQTPSSGSPDPVAAARAVANESGHQRAIVPDEVIYESDVIELINKEPEKYRSPSFQKKLTDAIRNGNYIRLS